MNITFATFTYYPERNGVSHVTQYLAEGLAQRGYSVTVICDLAEGHERRERYHDVDIIRIRASANNVAKKEKITEYLRSINESDPDVFICVCTQTWTIDWLKGKTNEIKCQKILYTHGFSGLYPYQGSGAKGLIYLLKSIKHNIKWGYYYSSIKGTIRAFDYITHISVSNRSYKYALDNHLGENVIIGNGVEEMYFAAPVCQREDVKAGLNDRKIRFLYVSNYGEGKNQKDLLSSFYKTKTTNTELIFVGSNDNVYLKELEGLKEELDKQFDINKQVEFLFGLTREDISKLMSECDVCVITSRMEACSLVLLEAAAKGMAIISTNVGNAHLIPGVITVNEIWELPRMMDMIANSPIIRIKCGEASRQYAVENAHIEKQLNSLEEIIKECEE